MLISAFGMCCGYYERIKTGTISISEFYKKRYIKTLPFFALLVLIDLIVTPSVDSFYGAFADLTLAFGLLPNAGSISVIGVGWFLGLVFVFYMIFPFFCFLLSSRKTAWISFAIALIFNYVCEVYFQVERNNILYSACYFIAGGLIFLYKDQWQKFVEKYRFIRFVLLILLIGLIITYYAIGSYTLIMLFIFSLMLLYAVGGGEGKNNKLLSNPITRFLSGISLEIYLCHMLFYRVVERCHLLYIGGNGIWGYIVACMLILACAIVFSFLMQKVILIIIEKITFKLRKIN